MGIVLSRAEVVRGLEPVMLLTTEQVRGIFKTFEDTCPVPALWERAFYELLGCFQPEQCSKAFAVIDTDSNGLIDAREVLGAIAVLSRGHLTDRMTLLFDIFDLNQEKEMAFDECFMMLRRTMGGLRKMVGTATPPEKVIHNMVKQVWKNAKKHRDVRVLPADWLSWWSRDASCRNALKMFTWQPEDHRGLPTPDQFLSVDYTKGTSDNTQDALEMRAQRLNAGRSPGRSAATLNASSSSRRTSDKDASPRPSPRNGGPYPGSGSAMSSGKSLVVPG